MSADDQETLRAELAAAAAALAEERARRISLSRELRILEDSRAEARSAALENEQAASAARFRTVEEVEARLATQNWNAELADQLSEIRTSKAFRFARVLGALARRTRHGGRRPA